MRLSAKRCPRRDGGVMLLEALIGLLIFSIGIMAMVAMQAASLQSSADARYRTDAVGYAEDLLGEIALGVDRSSAAALKTSLESFQHQPSGASCDYSGSASGNPTVLAWIDDMTGVTAGSRLRLPGATGAMQQVLVDTSGGAHNRVRITLCWKAPKDPVPRKHIVSTNVY